MTSQTWRGGQRGRGTRPDRSELSESMMKSRSRDDKLLLAQKQQYDQAKRVVSKDLLQQQKALQLTAKSITQRSPSGQMHARGRMLNQLGVEKEANEERMRSFFESSLKFTEEKEKNGGTPPKSEDDDKSEKSADLDMTEDRAVWYGDIPEAAIIDCVVAENSNKGLPTKTEANKGKEQPLRKTNSRSVSVPSMGVQPTRPRVPKRHSVEGFRSSGAKGAATSSHVPKGIHPSRSDGDLYSMGHTRKERVKKTSVGTTKGPLGKVYAR